MRLPRMTMWRWLLVVAAIGLMIGGGILLKQRRDYFRSLVQSHQKEVDASNARGNGLKARIGRTSETDREEILRLHRDYERMTDRAEHHSLLVRKYERAARYPWLLVEPDPPEPD